MFSTAMNFRSERNLDEGKKRNTINNDKSDHPTPEKSKSKFFLRDMQIKNKQPNTARQNVLR